MRDFRRLTNQFTVSSLWLTPEGKEECKKAAVAALKRRGCDFFRHIEAFDIEMDHKIIRTDGWISEPCDKSEARISANIDGLIYSPIP